MPSLKKKNMKNLIIGNYGALIATCLLCCQLSAGNGNKVNIHDTTCLEISGAVVFHKYGFEGLCKVELVYNNTVVDSLWTDNKKPFVFRLKKNAYYGIRVSSAGNYDRIISVCTDLPPAVPGNLGFKFHFDTELVELTDKSVHDVHAMDLPIAIVSFNKKTGWFYYDENYTAHLKQQIYLTGKVAHRK
jgi:hypothetical protein